MIRCRNIQSPIVRQSSLVCAMVVTCWNLLVAGTDVVQADDESGPAKASVQDAVKPDTKPELPPLKALPGKLTEMIKNQVPLNPEKTVFLDTKKRRVLLRTQVACDDCMLEMLCCTENSKEHESVLWLRSKAFVVHSALLALKVEPGKPASFSPEFVAPTGPRINIFANWVDEDGKLQRVDARNWMRHSIHRYFSHPVAMAPPDVELPHMELRYDRFNNELLWFGPMTLKQKNELLKLWDNKDYQAGIEKFFDQSQSRPMKANFVFGGSRSYVNEQTGRKQYAAEGGYLICVANFAAAMIDVKEASSASDGGQVYESWPEKIPPEDTPVILELVPERQK